MRSALRSLAFKNKKGRSAKWFMCTFSKKGNSADDYDDDQHLLIIIINKNAIFSSLLSPSLLKS